MKLDDALQPSKIRLAPGMIPDSAVNLLSNYVIFAVRPLRALGIPPSAAITSAFRKVLEKEWTIEGKLAPNLAMGQFPWEKTFPHAVYRAFYNELAPLSMDERIQYGWDMQKHAIELSRRNLQAIGGKVHRFLDSSGIWFFYRGLVNMLYATMKAMVKMGLPAKNAYFMIRHMGLSAAESAELNKAIIDLSAKDWEELGFSELFSQDEKNTITRERQIFEKRIRSEWSAYAADQQALRRKVESLENFKRAVEAAATPFEMIKKTLGAGIDVLQFLGKVPGIVWLGVAGIAGYFLIVDPLLSKAKKLTP